MLARASRTPIERIGDLKAQIAANFTGEKRILELARKYSCETFVDACSKSLVWTEQLARKQLAKIPNGKYVASDCIEGPLGNNIRLTVRLTLSDANITVDYSGTDRQVEYPLNAVYGVTLSGVYYVVRTLIQEDIPVNYGTFKTISVNVPEGTILNPTFPFPVAGGNLETSQRNADLLYRVFSQAVPDTVPADSGGCMNNVMMGGKWKSEPWTFYETIGVGLGGKSWADGIDGIQANMTNTMNTPIEEIERSFPLLVEQYELRSNSGGKGRYRGGTGIIRSYKALTNNVTVTILTDRNKNRPHGLFKGRPGAGTKVSLVKNGKRPKRIIPVKTTLTLRKNDTLEICTAGGGGYGNPMERLRLLIDKDRETQLAY
jgi:N-methylhydantoinase B